MTERERATRLVRRFAPFATIEAFGGLPAIADTGSSQTGHVTATRHG